jgi:hypothetical protein
VSCLHWTADGSRRHATIPCYDCTVDALVRERHALESALQHWRHIVVTRMRGRQVGRQELYNEMFYRHQRIVCEP